MEKDVKEFIKIYIALLYKNGYCYYDVSKENLDEYLKELGKLMEYKDLFKANKHLKKIIEFDQEKNNYSNFINCILEIISDSKTSFYCEKSQIIMLNYEKEELDNILNNKENYKLIKVVETIVDYMINYLNMNIKIKVLKSNYMV